MADEIEQTDAEFLIDDVIPSIGDGGLGIPQEWESRLRSIAGRIAAPEGFASGLIEREPPEGFAAWVAESVVVDDYWPNLEPGVYEMNGRVEWSDGTVTDVRRLVVKD